MAGIYANFANVSHSDYEFTITFARVDHEVEEEEIPGVVVSRINLSPRFMRELIDAMEDNWSKWQAKGGIPSLPEYDGPPGGPADRTSQRPSAYVTAYPIRCTASGCVPNSFCRRRGGCGSASALIARRFSSSMKDCGSSVRFSAKASARCSTRRDRALLASAPANETMPSDSTSAGRVAGVASSSSVTHSVRRCTRCIEAGAAIASQ